MMFLHLGIWRSAVTISNWVYIRVTWIVFSTTVWALNVMIIVWLWHFVCHSSYLLVWCSLAFELLQFFGHFNGILELLMLLSPLWVLLSPLTLALFWLLSPWWNPSSSSYSIIWLNQWRSGPFRLLLQLIYILLYFKSYLIISESISLIRFCKLASKALFTLF